MFFLIWHRFSEMETIELLSTNFYEQRMMWIFKNFLTNHNQSFLFISDCSFFQDNLVCCKIRKNFGIRFLRNFGENLRWAIHYIIINSTTIKVYGQKITLRITQKISPDSTDLDVLSKYVCKIYITTYIVHM